MNTRSSLSSKLNSNKPTHSVLGRSRTEPPLASGYYFGTSWQNFGPRKLSKTPVWMWRNEVGVMGIYRYPQRVTSSHTSARVSALMLPVTCAVTHGHTHIMRHVPDTCREKNPRPHVPQNAQPSCVATHRPLHVSPHA
ncbi:hypothetical protein F2Q70_00022207 [Brassica cretica]|uniref:Uncharacterized protein n=1 Tax=Brassica cretica TaxID=69181 RepID=A0A8S9HMF3_BRACR|nr:hypothetical protein F2Q70_00022207 [Brassica cretica]KAF2559269.1 hypothetical protein F2Q68_00016108 [Brassica cretica]